MRGSRQVGAWFALWSVLTAPGYVQVTARHVGQATEAAAMTSTNAATTPLGMGPRVMISLTRFG